MIKKALSVIGVVLLLFLLHSCGGKTEQTLLKSYFHAVTLNDNTTMATMALKPVALEYESWNIVSSGEERLEAASLSELNKKEMELKKELEDHVGPTVEAQDALYVAQDKLDTARTKAARAAAQKELEETQRKFEEEREIHRQLQKAYNDAKAESSKEEEISLFSLGAGELPNIRDMQGEVSFKDVQVRLGTKSGTKNYMFRLRRYVLRDEDQGRRYSGRLVIVSIEPIE